MKTASEIASALRLGVQGFQAKDQCWLKRDQVLEIADSIDTLSAQNAELRKERDELGSKAELADRFLETIEAGCVAALACEVETKDATRDQMSDAYLRVWTEKKAEIFDLKERLSTAVEFIRARQFHKTKVHEGFYDKCIGCGCSRGMGCFSDCQAATILAASTQEGNPNEQGSS